MELAILTPFACPSKFLLVSVNVGRSRATDIVLATGVSGLQIVTNNFCHLSSIF